MKIAIVYDSSTGTTAAAARAMGELFEQHGHDCQVQSVAVAKAADVAAADLICLGSWVQGWFIIKQHPTSGTMEFVERLGDLSGKYAVVFCTYKLAIGSTLKRMARALEGKGATIIGDFSFRGPEPDGNFTAFAATLGK